LSVRGIGAGTKDRTGSNASTNPGVGVENEVKDVLKRYRRVVVIGVHGWLPSVMIRTEVKTFLFLLLSFSIITIFIIVAPSETPSSVLLSSQITCTDCHIRFADGTSIKFTDMIEQAPQEFEAKHGVKFEKITNNLLEGDGTISKRVDKGIYFEFYSQTRVVDLTSTKQMFSWSPRSGND